MDPQSHTPAPIGRPSNVEVLQLVQTHGPLTTIAIATASRASLHETKEVIGSLEAAGELMSISDLWTVRPHE